MKAGSDDGAGAATLEQPSRDTDIGGLDLFGLLRQAIEERRFGGKECTFDLGYGLFAKMADSREAAYNEFETGRDLRAEGIHIPEMIRLIEPQRSIFRPAHRRLPGEHARVYHLIMEYVQGQPLVRGKRPGRLEEMTFQHAKQLVLDELTKVLELRILPLDADHVGNSLYDPARDKAWLLDLMFWRRGSREEIANFRRDVITPMREPGYRFRTQSIDADKFYRQVYA